MNKLKYHFLWWLVFLGTITFWFIWYAYITWTWDLPTQKSWDLVTASSWNDIISRINLIWKNTDGIYSSWWNIGIGTNNPKAKLEINWSLKSINSLSNVARPICYSVFTNWNTTKSLIMLPLNNNNDDLDSRCHTDINSFRHAAWIAKSNYENSDCTDIENLLYGWWYTGYVEESVFERNRNTYQNCNSSNAMICCSRSFPN